MLLYKKCENVLLDDVDRDLKLIENLHAGNKEAQEFRKKLMKEYRISRDEIDN